MREEPISRFNLMVSCAVSLYREESPQKCKLNLDISMDTVNAILLRTKHEVPEFDTVNICNFDIMTIDEDFITFSGSNQKMTLYFVNNKADLKRVVMSLAESGTIVPLNVTKCAILSKPTFIPKGEYLTSQSKLIANVGILLANQVKSLRKDALPNDSVFVDGTLRFFQKRYVRQAHKYFTGARDLIVTRGPVSVKYCTKWLLKTVPKSNKFENERGKLKSIQKIDADAGSISEGLRSVCCDICKLASMTGRKYVEGNVEIARRIVLMLNGKSDIVNDENELPTTLAEMSQKDKANFAYDCYMKLSQFFDTEGAADNIRQLSLRFLQNYTPYVMPFVWNHELGQCFGSEYDIGSLFSNRFPEVWRLWFWIFRTEEPLKTFAAFNASVSFLALDDLMEFKDDDFASHWDDALSKVGLKESMNYAQFLLIKDADSEE